MDRHGALRSVHWVRLVFPRAQSFLCLFFCFFFVFDVGMN